MNRRTLIANSNVDTLSILLNSVCKKICIYVVIICIIGLPVLADDAPISETTDAEVVKPMTDDVENPQTETRKEVITGTSDKMERDQKTGITILIGNAKTIRTYEDDGEVIGFLNADRITLKTDPITDETVEIIAEKNVEIRDDDMFATCEHAIMNNLTNIIILKEKVVVTQEKDKLETKLFTYNRTTGKQTGVGDVKFKVSITQATPDPQENTPVESKSNEDGSTPDDSETDTDNTKDADDSSKNGTDSGEAKSEDKTAPTESETEEKVQENNSDEQTEPAESETDSDEQTDETDTEEDTDSDQTSDDAQ